MHAGARVGAAVLSLSSFSLLVAAGCSGGADSGPTDGGASSTSSSSGGPSSGSSGSSGASGDAGACTELRLGGTNDPAIGGGATSKVVAQATSDLAGASPRRSMHGARSRRA